MKKFVKPLIYIFALMILGISIALMQNTNLGMPPWDALQRNFFEGVPIQYTYLAPIFSVVLIILAYIINWKKPELKMIIPVIVSSVIGLSIDLALLFVPNVSDLNIIYNYLYLFSAMLLISIVLNVIIYCGYTLPALEQFTLAISNRLNISFGRAKLVGEFFAFIMTIIVGLLFKHQSNFFFIGQTTIIVLLFIGLLIDLFRNITYKVLGRII